MSPALRIAARTGKAKAWAISMVLAVATFLWAFTLSAGDILPFAVICILSGSALGADLAIPPAIVADRLHAAGDQPRAARYFAANAFCAKSAFALATGLSLRGTIKCSHPTWRWGRLLQLGSVKKVCIRFLT